MASNQDVEINLGTGKLLGLFFALVVVCAVFFALGYSLGKNSLPQAVGAAGEPPPATPTNAAKPRAAAAPGAQPAPSSSDELTFYKTVEQKNASAQLTPAPAAEANTESKPAPEMHPGYIVQVAAVSKQEDAQALVGALRKKNYPVFVMNNNPGDKLFHVQVGPFNDIQDAEAMRGRLAGDGYNPILKK
jgi:cell division septation protein DedD